MDEYLDRPDARLAYDRSGPAEAEHSLVVTHSLATSREWEDQAGILNWSAVTAAGLQLVRADARGHGTSTGAPVPEHYQWRTRADDLLALADAVSPNRPVDGLGESTGCGVLLWAALTRPDRFRRLVLVIPPTTGDARAQQAELYLAAADLIELRGTAAWEHLTATASPAPILQRGGWTRPDWVPIPETLLPAVLRGAATSTLPDDETLRSLTHRTLILTWADDLNHPVSSAEHLATLLPHNTLETATTPDGIRTWGHRVAQFLQDT